MFGEVIGTLVAAWVIVLLAACQPTSARRSVGLIYATISAGHLLGVSWWIEGQAYFITAAGADVAIIWLILQQPRLSGIGVPVLRVCLAEITINAVGWYLWWNGHELAAYNALYQCLQIWLMWVLFKKDRANALGRYRVDHGGDFLRVVAGARPNHVSRGS